MVTAPKKLHTDDFLYEGIAQKIIGLIEKGTFPPGSRLPSIRHLSQQWKVSVSTVVEAYRILDDRGVVDIRTKSGHFVKRKPGGTFQKPPRKIAKIKPASVNVSDLTLMILRDTLNPDIARLGAGIPCADLLPIEKLHRAMGTVARRNPIQGAMYEFSPGHERLRNEIAKRSIDSGCAIHPDEIVITNGCLEAVTLCLQAICRPGDVVAIESPTYYGFLQIIEVLGLQALEIPCTYPDGIGLEALQFALENHPIRACIVDPIYNNPLGSVMPDGKKKQFVDLMTEYQVPVIEDDIYSDLCFSEQRPKAVKAFDRSGIVLHCSSFTKSLAPGYRIGYVCPGEYQKKIEKIKTVTSVAVPSLPQMAVAEFLATGGYGAHLRRIRRIYQSKMDWLIEAVRQYFPKDSTVYPPSGGYLLWIELPRYADSVLLYESALRAGISIAPGVMFSSKGRYQHCLRLNAAYVTPQTGKHIQMLGKLIQQQETK